MQHVSMYMYDFRYCTGGIRCEMASAYIRTKGAEFKNVFQVVCSISLNFTFIFMTFILICYISDICSLFSLFVMIVIWWYSKVSGGIS